MCVPLGLPQNQHILTTTWTMYLKDFLDFECRTQWTLKYIVVTFTCNQVFGADSLFKVRGVVRNVICALWPVNSGEKTAVLSSTVCMPGGEPVPAPSFLSCNTVRWRVHEIEGVAESDTWDCEHTNSKQIITLAKFHTVAIFFNLCLWLYIQLSDFTPCSTRTVKLV